MGHFTQEFFAEGEAKGLARGRAEGEANALIRVLQKRFGAIPSSFRERIFAADVASIEMWLDRVVDADDLESVFLAAQHA